jgi:hypothetical protein
VTREGALCNLPSLSDHSHAHPHGLRRFGRL